MKTILRNALALAAVTLATQAAAQATFYENEGYTGRRFIAVEKVSDLGRFGFNDRASSALIEREPWQVCDDAQFNGRCVVLRPGNYPSLAAMGLNDRISSVRTMGGDARYDVNPYLPQQVASNEDRHDWRRRHNERLYEASVVAVHAVVGPPEQRCWIENEQVTEHHDKVPGAIVGALIGGILGHQVGGGSGRDLATAGGAVAGAAVGANAGGHGDRVVNHEVQRCANVPSNARPEFWDVTYVFEGQQHFVQLSAPPGPTVTVNERGEPRE